MVVVGKYTIWSNVNFFQIFKFLVLEFTRTNAFEHKYQNYPQFLDDQRNAHLRFYFTNKKMYYMEIIFVVL